MRGRGEFTFDPSLHDYAQKTFLGRAFPAVESRSFTNPHGILAGEAELDMLIAHPSTARFIATKLLCFLLWYEPTPAIVERVSGVYTRTGGDIRSMVRASLDLA